MKKTFKILLAAAVMLVSGITAPLSAAAAESARYELPFDPIAESYLLVSLDTGEVVFEKNAHVQRTPASLTKMLTTYVAMKYTDDLDATTVTQTTRHTDELYGMNSSTADIRNGETLTMRQLLYAMMLPSGNEAANMVADHIGNGSRSNFCMLMNTEAKRIGCTDTNFSNPHGLFSDNHYTTAWDMYLIAKACYETPGFMDIATTVHYYLPANTRHAEKYLISSTILMQNKGYPSLYRDYVQGMKTGSTEEAGRNFVTVCESDGERYILVVMGAPYYREDGSKYTTAAFEAAAQIMDHFFSEYSLKPANGLEAPVTEVALRYVKDRDNLLLYPAGEIYSVLPNNVDESAFQKVFNVPEQVYAPINAGDVVGTVSYYIAGDLVGTTDLIAAESFERDTLIFLIEKLQEIATSLYFKVVLVVTAVLVIALVGFRYWLGKRYEKMQKIHRGRK
ncbi:MAG: D-alanyl-D-alanine carboxypeptidase [Oscillospiraceae bacterium]|nr:D-alanyl-D-alanine carboxypeptidase [Oscillospiraceae bacterium]